MDTEIGLFSKAKIEKLCKELGKKEVVFFSPEDDEAKFDQGFKNLKISERDERKETRRKMYDEMSKHKLIEVQSKDGQSIEKGDKQIEEEIQLVPVSYVLAAFKLKVGCFVSDQ